jgi:hypothetical protein
MRFSPYKSSVPVGGVAIRNSEKRAGFRGGLHSLYKQLLSGIFAALDIFVSVCLWCAGRCFSLLLVRCKKRFRID